MPEITLQDYKNSFKTGSYISDMAKMVQCIKGPTGEIPVLIFKCENFTFFLPHSQLDIDLKPEYKTTSRITMILVKYIGTIFTFKVKVIDEKRKTGILEKKEYDRQKMIECFKNRPDSKPLVTNGSIVDFQIQIVTPQNIIVYGCGLVHTLKAVDFPNIKHRNLTKVFRKNDTIQCKIKKIVLNKVSKTISLDLEPINYPKAPDIQLEKDTISFGEIIVLTKNSVLVDCDGKVVVCSYPDNYVPINHSNVTVKITNVKKDPNNEEEIEYRGRILYCELPFGTY